jgi:hypothetical protein
MASTLEYHPESVLALLRAHGTAIDLDSNDAALAVLHNGAAPAIAQLGTAEKAFGNMTSNQIIVFWAAKQLEQAEGANPMREAAQLARALLGTGDPGVLGDVRVDREALSLGEGGLAAALAGDQDRDAWEAEQLAVDIFVRACATDHALDAERVRRPCRSRSRSSRTSSPRGTSSRSRCPPPRTRPRTPPRTPRGSCTYTPRSARASRRRARSTARASASRSPRRSRASARCAR